MKSFFKLLDQVNNLTKNKLIILAHKYNVKDLDEQILNESIDIDLWMMESLVYPEPFEMPKVKIDEVSVEAEHDS